MGKPVSRSVDAKSGHIVLRVKASNSHEVHFRLKVTTQMSKMKKYFSDRVGFPVTALRFLFDGRRINDEDTPKILGMENDDVIEVYHEQTGGFSSTLTGNKIQQ